MRTLRKRLARAVATALTAGAVLATAGCGTPPPQPGQAREAVLASWGAPTARHASAGGAERMEYSSGPFGRTTWMIDLDAGGRVTAVRQVLNEAYFAEFQERAPGMSRATLLRELGTPGERRGVGRFGEELWSWRYPTNDCLWFQVVLDPAADKVVSSGYGIDPRCDAASDRE